MLCADDFALTEGVNQAIIDLISRNVPGAISCLPISDLWPHSARLLGSVPNRQSELLKLGISLRLVGNFTPLSTGFQPENAVTEGALPGKADLIKAARHMQLDRDVLAAECRAQIRRFTAHLGQAPDFIALQPEHLLYDATALAVTDALSHFGFEKLSVICPARPRPAGLISRMERLLLARSVGKISSQWSCRHLVTLMHRDRIPPRSSWHEDGRVWTFFRPAQEDSRLERFDEDPELRAEQYQWFLKT